MTSPLTPWVRIDLVFQAWDPLQAIDAVDAGIPPIKFWGWRDKDINAIAERAQRHRLKIAAVGLDPSRLAGPEGEPFLKVQRRSIAAALKRWHQERSARARN